MKIKRKMKKVKLGTILLTLTLAFIIMLAVDTKIYADPTGLQTSGTVKQKNVGTGFDYYRIPIAGNPINESLKAPFRNIWKSLITILQIASVAGVIFAGVRYMFASSESKADIKKSMIHLVIGMVIVFAASTLIEIVMNVFNEVT